MVDRVLASEASIALMLVFSATACASAAVDLYVAPNGDDGRSGRSEAEAVRTLSKASDIARALRRADEAKDGVTVHVRRGTYDVRETLTLAEADAGTADSPLVFRSATKGKAVLRGGTAVTGWDRCRDQVLKCDLKKRGLGQARFGQLFFGGKRMILARTPNVDPEDVHGGVWAHMADPASPGSKRAFLYNPKDIDPSKWSRPTDGRVCLFCRYDWRWNRIGVKAVKPEEHRIELARDATYELTVGDRYFVEGLVEEIDSPGEWALDRTTSTLYFHPPADVSTADVVVPLVDTLVSLEKTRHVRFEGFVFEACDGTAIAIEDAEHCRVAASVIRNCGGWGVTIRGGRACAVVGCDISATGRGGVLAGGGDRKTLTPSKHVVTNNYIHHIAAFEKTYNTAVNVGGVGNTASHNLIHDTPHAGMTLAGNDNVIEYNVIRHTNLESTDTGGIYSCPRDWTQRGNAIRYNVWHDIGGFGKASSWQPVQAGKAPFKYPHFTWGIYMDDPTSGNHIVGNILYRVPICGLHNHGGRDNVFENNVIVDCPAFRAGMLSPNWGEWPNIYKRFRAVCGPGSPYFDRYPALRTYKDDHPEEMSGLRFERNIVYYTKAGTAWLRGEHERDWGANRQQLYSFRMRDVDFAKNHWDRNLVYAEPGLEFFVDLQRLPGDRQRLSWAEWQALGADAHSTLGDPLFVDPENHDYRLRPGSPALALGFRPIPVEKIGPYEDELRASWPIVETPGAKGVVKPIVRYVTPPFAEPVPARPMAVRDGIGHTLAKLRAGKPVRVAYYGGGIHYAGAGWRKAYMTWLRERYPKSEIAEINAGICDCVRGSGFSVYRYAHDVLAHEPDLVLVDYASDDHETPPRAIWRAVEAVVRQTRRADPEIDVVFVYAFRAGMEEAYAKGESPMAVSAYERLADRYGIPSINMGYAVAAAQETSKGKKAFLDDGVRPNAEGNGVYAKALIDGFGELAKKAESARREMPKPLAHDNYERARLMAVEQSMTSGEWRRLPGSAFKGRFQRHFDAIWETDTPGARLTFQFKGTAASLFALTGPDGGVLKVTVDGRDAGRRQHVDKWCYYHRLMGFPLAAGLPEGVHTVTVELLPDVPDRTVAVDEAKRLGRYDPKLFEGTALRIGWIRLLGEPAE